MNSTNIYSISNPIKCGRFPVEQIDYVQPKQRFLLKKAANDIVFEGKSWDTVLEDVMTNLRRNGQRYRRKTVRMIETRLRRLVYKADIFNVHMNMYSTRTKHFGYGYWCKKKPRRSRQCIRKNTKRPSSMQKVLASVIAIPAVIVNFQEERIEERIEETPVDFQEERIKKCSNPLMKWETEWEKRRMIYEQQMRTGMIYLTPPGSPMLNTKHEPNITLDVLSEPFSPICSNLSNY